MLLYVFAKTSIKTIIKVLYLLFILFQLKTQSSMILFKYLAINYCNVKMKINSPHIVCFKIYLIILTGSIIIINNVR